MIEQEIIRVRDVRISIGALLDKASAAQVLAAEQSEDAKENAWIVSDRYMLWRSCWQVLGPRGEQRRWGFYPWQYHEDFSSMSLLFGPWQQWQRKWKPQGFPRVKVSMPLKSQGLTHIEDLLVKQEERWSQHDAAVLEEYRAANKNAQQFQSSLLDVMKNIVSQ